MMSLSAKSRECHIAYFKRMRSVLSVRTELCLRMEFVSSVISHARNVIQRIERSVHHVSMAFHLEMINAN